MFVCVCVCVCVSARTLSFFLPALHVYWEMCPEAVFHIDLITLHRDELAT